MRSALGVEADSIVFDNQFNDLSLLQKAHLNAVGLTVFGNIVQ
jgi:hypothetical protein